MDLDTILDQALDEFEEQEMTEKISKAESSVDKNASKTENENFKMDQLMASMHDLSYGKSLQSTLKVLSTNAEGNQSVDKIFEQFAHQFDLNQKSKMMPTDPNDINQVLESDKEVAATLQMIGSAQSGMEGFEAGKLEEVGETMMDDMMAQFESLGEKEDYNEVSIFIIFFLYSV
jgi:hypothetical protein